LLNEIWIWIGDFPNIGPTKLLVIYIYDNEIDANHMAHVIFALLWGIRKSKTKQSLNRYESRHTNKSLAKDTFHVLAGEKRKKFAESKKQLIYTHVPALFSYSLFVIRDIFICICEILFSVIQREFQLTSFCLRLIR